MAYQYVHIPASLKMTAGNGINPKNEYISLFQQTLKDGFYNASDWWNIQEEESVGSRIYQPIDVRINHVINAETGLKLGDDWKTLLFSEPTHTVELGRYYSFDDSMWLTTNTEVIKNLTGTCTVRRCNNTLRWVDEATGAYYNEPCCIEYMVKEPRNYVTQGSPFMTPGGFLHIEIQFNDRTNLINQNQRFMFGNPRHWTCYKVVGTGLNDFRNINTYDNLTARILSVDLIADFVNEELDDIVNGIADVNTNVYTISLNRSSAEGAPGDTLKLDATVTYNGKTVERPITWTSDNIRIATATSGSIALLKSGSCVITANITNNIASDSCTILVSASPVVNSDIVISPDTNYVLEGMTESYSAYLYENGVVQGDAFVISCDGNAIPSASYVFTQIDGNNFSIKNNMRNNVSNLTVTCTTGSPVITKNFDIYIKGGW